MINITPILNALIKLVAALVIVFLIPWIKSKTSNEQLSKMLTLVRIGVEAAEQLYAAGTGETKKSYVVGFLNAKGYAIDDSLNNAIESAVIEMNAALKLK